IEGDERNGHVRRVSCDAGGRRSENGGVTLEAAARRAPGARRALVAGSGEVLEVDATRPLEEVATDGGDVAQLAGSTGEHRLGEHRIAASNPPVRGEVAVRRPRAD